MYRCDVAGHEFSRDVRAVPAPLAASGRHPRWQRPSFDASEGDELACGCASLEWPHLEALCSSEVAPLSTYLPLRFVTSGKAFMERLRVEGEIESGAVRGYPARSSRRW